MATHAQKESNLSHSSDAHIEQVQTQQILDNIKVLHMTSDRSDLRLAGVTVHKVQVTDSQQSKGRRKADLNFFFLRLPSSQLKMRDFGLSLFVAFEKFHYIM